MLTSIEPRAADLPEVGRSRAASLIDAVNGRWHKVAMLIFGALVVSHWAEHLFQAVQIYVLGWPRPQALGALGLVFPWLVSSEMLHYGHALVTLVGLILLQPALHGRARMWWNVALAIQFWHHAEHLLLISQVVAGANLLGSPVPMSVLQFFFPRVELHLFYNGIVTTPMVLAMYFHRYPTKQERKASTCTCPVVRVPARSRSLAA